MSLALAILALGTWLYLLLGRGFFWRARVMPRAPAPQSWPDVAAIVPARNEAEHVGAAISSLLAQEYPGRLSVVLVDDHSSDGTAELARRAAAGRDLAVVAAGPLPPRWSGKLWALAEGVRHAAAGFPSPAEGGRGRDPSQSDGRVRAIGDGPGHPPAPSAWAPPSPAPRARGEQLFLFTDADIVHEPGTVAQMVAWLEAERRDLVSLMVLLRAASAAERLLIPAFVFFFAMLYPFAWAADPRRRTAAAAGGAILVRRAAFLASGGFDAIKGELIDDCALARQMKRRGRIALALTRGSRSLRAYPRLADVCAMVARTAYTQLHHSRLLLGGTVAGLGLVYLAPPALALAGGAAAWIGGAAWAAMTLSYLPMLRFYRLSPLWAPLLPLVAAIYLGATVASAVRHYQGSGGTWKGRVQWQSQR